MGIYVMLWGAEKLVPAEYWCPYGTCIWDREFFLIFLSAVSKQYKTKETDFIQMRKMVCYTVNSA